ncbi:MAG: hypothetical protein K8I00_07900, partial [Candidatus Omnitrophica bacterium]|nr:hypothetical protein [Candidatus Omnitrophota bacterium]
MTKTLKKGYFSKETVTFMLLTIVTVFVFMNFVDMTPHVDNDFFFSTEDPNYQADIQISQLFERNDAQILISVTGDIFNADYRKRINYMTEIISRDPAVSTVKSITNGPKDIEDALKSPLWRRILIADNQKSTNIVVILNQAESPKLIPRIENLIAVLSADDFQVRISGFPYIVEQIRRHLLIDLNVFSGFAFLLFSVIIVLIFHSWRILLGMIITCINAGAITF